MKRIALLLVFVMALLLVSCSGNNDVRGEVIELGSTSDNKYENKFFGIGCKLNDDWTFLSNGEIREMNDITNDMGDDEMASTLETAEIIYDMSAVKSNSSGDIVINIENLGIISSATMKEEEYAAASIEGVKSTFEELQATNINAKEDSVTFAGINHAAIKVNCEISGINGNRRHTHSAGHDRNTHSVIIARISLNRTDIIDKLCIGEKIFGNKLCSERVARHQNSFCKIVGSCIYMRGGVKLFCHFFI